MSEQQAVRNQITGRPTITRLASRGLHRAAINPSPVQEVSPIVHEVLRSPDQPLDAKTRAFMEPRFGHDFSGVRIHTDTSGIESAREMDARLYTMGRGGTLDAGPRDAGLPGGVVSAPQPVPALPTPPSPRRQACISTEQIPHNRGGMTLLQGNVYDYFETNIDWRNTTSGCDCSCGEYRQFVKGYIKINGQKQNKLLWGTAILDEKDYHEDGEGASRYGHRGDSETSIDRFLPERSRGCSYRGRDTPGLAAPPGTHLDMNLTFKGQTYDVCQNTFGRIHEWNVQFNDFIP